MQRAKANDVLGTTNRGNPAESGLCTLCRADCAGKCETWLSCLKGREVLYPRDFGQITAGSETTVPDGACYGALRVQGRLYGAVDAPESARSGDVLFTDVSLAAALGNTRQIQCRYPFLPGALGSTAIAARYWDALAAGCALCGIPIVIGENVVGIDPAAEFKNGKVKKAPELDRRIAAYQRYQDGAGGVFVQMNVEDARNGVAEYVIEKFGNDIVLELKWGQGAKNIGGEISLNDIEYARFLSKRGYLLDPDPHKQEVEAAFQAGLTHFARHSRMGYTNLQSAREVCEDFLKTVGRLRSLGFANISLKTGAYGMEGLALALRLAAESELTLLNIDGAGGGTGMSPWDMMEHWGIPPLHLHAKAHEYACLLEKRGLKPSPLAFGGGFAKSSAIFKGLALGAPYVKLICMGRALLIPVFLGSNIEGALYPARRAKAGGNWDALPKTVTDIGIAPETIFAGYYSVEKKIGKAGMDALPLGAVALWTLLDKLAAGLQQFMAGARKFDLKAISRTDIVSGNFEVKKVTGIPFMTDFQDETAKTILME